MMLSSVGTGYNTAEEMCPNGHLSLSSGIIDLRHSLLTVHLDAVPLQSETTLISCAAEQSAFLDQNMPYDPSVIGRRVHDDSSSSLWHRRPDPGAEESTNCMPRESDVEVVTPVQQHNPPHVQLSTHLPVQHAQGFNGISDPGSASPLESDPYVQLSLEDKKRVFDWFKCHYVEIDGLSA
ncbi:hypothetical protein K438DRAFT_1929992 [Mycena galopus ATCC 62051]|nr:hypothetical protein K438DRAFT_1929992 [Mycena galopus ATCC 62051]